MLVFIVAAEGVNTANVSQAPARCAGIVTGGIFDGMGGKYRFNNNNWHIAIYFVFFNTKNTGTG
ncbi:MAG: hypothetical protein V4857_02055 [Pseudomonadota bacterium]